MAEARSRCSVRELLLWHGFYRVNPWGPDVDDLRAARLVALVYNSVPREGEAAQVEDYRLGLQRPKETTVQSVDDMAAVFRTLVTRGLATVEKAGDDGIGRQAGRNSHGPDE